MTYPLPAWYAELPGHIATTFSSGPTTNARIDGSWLVPPFSSVHGMILPFRPSYSHSTGS